MDAARFSYPRLDACRRALENESLSPGLLFLVSVYRAMVESSGGMLNTGSSVVNSTRRSLFIDSTYAVRMLL